MLKHKFLLALLFSVAFMLSSGELSAQKNRGGHYKSGKGSSHKGGSYKNARTNNHYTTRRRG